MRFNSGVLRKFAEPIADVRRTSINGLPGLFLTHASGELHSIALEITDGEVTTVYVVRNPDQLAGAARTGTSRAK